MDSERVCIGRREGHRFNGSRECRAPNTPTKSSLEGVPFQDGGGRVYDDGGETDRPSHDK